MLSRNGIAEARAKAIGMGLKQIDGEPNYFVSADGIVYSIKVGYLKPIRSYRVCRSLNVSMGCGTEADPKRINNLARLVASRFVPNPDRRSHFIHLDRDYLNCKSSNLAWVESTLIYAGNTLTIENVAEIERLQGVYSRDVIADRFGIRPVKITQIWNVARRAERLPERWKQGKI